MLTTVVPLVVRGKIIEQDLVTFEGRRGGMSFSTPDVNQYLDTIVLSNPLDMADLYAITLDEIIDFLCELGTRVPMSSNKHMREAYEASKDTSGLTPKILEYLYEKSVPALFKRPLLEEMIEQSAGREHMEGWVPHTLIGGRVEHVRAFGARTVHINAGNNPSVAALCLARNALTRGDAIVKSPSNDPLTAAALALTMIEMEPDHPITKHFSVGYWKGGDEAFEAALYKNTNIEKIVAWGGFASMKHITKYLGPGVDLVPMDPKLSSTIIGKEVFEDEATMRTVARRLACDIGARNQEPCTSARVVYIQSGTDDAGLANLNVFGKYVYDAMQALPAHASGPHPNFDPVLKGEIDGLMGSDWHHIIGGLDTSGAIIISQMDEVVDFWESLGCRVANLVPIDNIDDALRRTTCHTGTTGIYPESLKQTVRDQIALRGGQRIVSLGHQNDGSASGPHDAVEPVRRMVRWIVDDCAVEDIPAFCEE